MTIATERPSRPSRPSRPTAPRGGELQGPTLSRVVGDGRRPRRSWRLGTRLFAGNALFLLLTLSLVVAFASWDANRRAERRIREAIAPVPRILHVYVDAQSRALVDNVRSLADSVGIKALLSLAGTDAAAATFHDSAVDLGRRLGPGTVFLFDAQGTLLARSDREPGEEAGRDFSGVSWVAGPLYTGHPASAFILEIKRRRSLSLIASAPVYQGQGDEARVNGVIAVASPLSEAQAAEIGRLISGEAVLVANVARRGKPLDLDVLASSPQLRGATPAALLDEPTREALFAARGKDVAGFDFTAGGERYTGAAVALTTGGGEPIAALLAARPKSAELAAFRALRGSVLAVGLLALALSLPLSFAFARRTSRPIEQLAEAAEGLRQGRLDVELPKARDAEVKTLARAFGALVIELEEKHALERLLAQTRRSDTAEIIVGDAAEADPDFILPGQLLAHRYHIKAVLGGGGMGRVFRAHDLDLDEEVAIKVLSNLPKRESTLQLLRKEIKVARAITHPNVVRVHDLGESVGLRFLTMEFVSGTTLRRLIDQRGHLELMPGLQVAKQLCRGLAAVHAGGMVHGDVKPENVMVLPNGIVKLMDFGLARRAGLESGQGGTVAGTPDYMSPEHARGAELDERSDLYAVGVLMFELFTGRTPFDAEEYADLLRLHLYAPPPDPRELRPELPATLSEVILFCLQKNRLERPGSATELEQALMRVRM
ncbi:MAG TPA: protein kinase [Thermoanaerobaculia bacterium]|nr:protein kinase [Thermoanaerobaculia bacterium]